MHKIIFIVGPTAVGKSETAVYLAKKINAEIISCDSMQVYKGMDIITSKPGSSLCRRAKHHLISAVKLSRNYDVSSYRKDALRCVKEITLKGKMPLFVGGTGLYMAILADGIFEEKAKDKNIRDKLYKLAEKKGSRYLFYRLKKVDPEAAKKIHYNDLKRIVRALEVFKATGKPISSLQKERRGLRNEYEVMIFCLSRDRRELYKNIERRVDKMFRAGLVKEVKGLLKRRIGRTASFAIGLKEIKGYLQGDYSLKEAKELIKLNTRRYAKRQLTWFRKDKKIKWINLYSGEKPCEIACRIYNLINN